MASIAHDLDLIAGGRDIDGICEQFESAWRSDRKPRIEDIVEQASPSISTGLLLRELVAIEMELRSEQGETPALRQYIRQFPRWAGWIDQLDRDEHQDETPAHDDPGDCPVAPELPGYRLIHEIGRGGVGVVWKAVDVRLNRQVALKLIRPTPTDSIPRFETRRFRREATTIARLNHPGVVQIYGVTEYEGCTVLILELIEGGNLSSLLDGTPRDTRWSARLIARLAHIVDYAHRRGVVHRDLKPANVLIHPPSDESQCSDDDDPAPVIADFGLAKQMDSKATISGRGVLFGTPSYMPPEQAEGRAYEATPASDVYSLGAILYELLTGRPPFEGDSNLHTIQMVCRDSVVPVRRWNPDVPEALEQICLHCLEKDPQRRYSTARALADDLQHWMAGRSAATPPPASFWKRTSSYLWTALAVGALLLAGMIGLAIGSGS